MMILPLETENHEHDALIIVLDPDNLERMKGGDPAEVKLKQLRQAGKNLVDPAIVLCYEKPSPKFNRLIQSGDTLAVIQYLQRGWQYRPEAGDHDRGPESIKDTN